VKEIGRYQVTGKRAYREHEPGEIFDALLDPNAEARATARGSIKLIERLTADLPPGKYRLPLGWPQPHGKEGKNDG
jgi:hypothetical protein